MSGGSGNTSAANNVVTISQRPAPLARTQRSNRPETTFRVARFVLMVSNIARLLSGRGDAKALFIT
jgi:hypothetical protein